MNVLDQHHGKSFSIFNADTVEWTAALPSNSIDFSVYSPPFSSLYVYSPSERDMGNVSSHAEFAAMYAPLVASILRATKPGHNTFVHCSDIPTTQSKDGVIGLFDFPALVRQVHEEAGWVYHWKVTISKDPVVEMQRTKAIGLLYKTFRTDATRCRGGMPDYCLVFRKPVDGATSKTPEPVIHDPGRYPVDRWQELASPVWWTVDQTNTLNARMARDAEDERHLCPLQLDVIERALTLYTNPGDTVFSPFTGVGSEGYVSLRHGRKFVGTELKPSYFKQACKYLDEAERLGPASDLFAMEAAS
jgi:hypothetical protein